jgi:hypothetical protein
MQAQNVDKQNRVRSPSPVQLSRSTPRCLLGPKWAASALPLVSGCRLRHWPLPARWPHTYTAPLVSTLRDRARHAHTCTHRHTLTLTSQANHPPLLQRLLVGTTSTDGLSGEPKTRICCSNHSTAPLCRGLGRVPRGKNQHTNTCKKSL